MGHDGTALLARDYETAALPLSYAGVWGNRKLCPITVIVSNRIIGSDTGGCFAACIPYIDLT